MATHLSTTTPPPDSCSQLRFDPQGPDQIKMPRGGFNFAHATLVVLGVSAIVLAIVALALG